MPVPGQGLSRGSRQWWRVVALLTLREKTMYCTPKRLIPVLLAGLFVASASHAGIILSVVPGSSNVALGDTLSVSLQVSNLHEAGGPPNNEVISSFDFAVGFDNSILNPTGTITFGDGATVFGDSWLGDGITNSVRDSDTNYDYLNAHGGGNYTGPAFSQAVELTELSFVPTNAANDTFSDGPPYLQDNQPDTFILASIEFSVIGTGSSALGIISDSLYSSTSSLLDAKGLDGITPLVLTINDASVTSSQVPLPGTELLMLLAGGLLAREKRRQ